MITVGKTYFDFRMKDESFARNLYGQWDEFCRVSFEKVVEDVLSAFDRPEQVIRIERLDLDLGTFTEKEFYTLFPVRLAEKLKDTFLAYLEKPDNRQVQLQATASYQTDGIFYYLLHGHDRWDALPEKVKPLPERVKQTVDTKPDEFRSFLLRDGHRENLRRRLVWQLGNPILETLVWLTEQNDPEFVVSYSRFLISSHPRLHRPGIMQQDYRNTIWFLILTYLWCESKGYYSKKQLVSRTIGQLAAHYDMKVTTLLHLLTEGVEKLTQGKTVIHELLRLLYELQGQMQPESRPVTGIVPDNLPLSWHRPLRNKLQHLLSEKQLRSATSLQESHSVYTWESIIRKELAQLVSCRHFIQEMSEQEIYTLVEIVLPQDSQTVISYAQELEKEKEKGMFEGKAGSSFRLVKWEFLFNVSLNAPAGTLDRKYFVEKVLQQLAAHYSLPYVSLLVFFLRQQDTLPLWLQAVLNQLYLENLEKHLPAFLQVKESVPSSVQASEQTKLKQLLIHPVSCRRLLSRLKKEEIIRITQIVFPADSPFIIAYAETLDKAEERGMLEGKAGSNFNLVKWEFIFLVSLNSSFNKRIFVLSVLRQLAAHYGLDVMELLRFFFLEQQKERYFLPHDVAEIIAGLWQEVEETRLQPDNKLTSFCKELEQLAGFEEAVREALLKGLQEHSIPQAPDLPFLLRLMSFYHYSRVSSFFRKNKKAVRELILSSPATLQRLHARTLLAPGLLEFLRGLYASDPSFLAAITMALPENRTLSLFAEITEKQEEGEEIIRHLLARESDSLRLHWRSQKNDQKQFCEFLHRATPALQWEWINRMGTVALRKVADEILLIERRLSFRLDKKFIASLLIRFTTDAYENLSASELFLQLYNEWFHSLDEAKRIKLVEVARDYPQWYPGLKESLRKIKYIPPKATEKPASPPEETMSNDKDALLLVQNGGIILFHPFFSMLFKRLGLIEEKDFIDPEARRKAIFFLQLLNSSDASSEWEEHELYLNKVLTGYPVNAPLPRSIEIKEEEQQMVTSLIGHVIAQWKRTVSVNGFQSSFVNRQGYLQEQDEAWSLSILPRGYDVLLETYPWPINLIKTPWMKKPMNVSWK